MIRFFRSSAKTSCDSSEVMPAPVASVAKPAPAASAVKPALVESGVTPAPVEFVVTPAPVESECSKLQCLIDQACLSNSNDDKFLPNDQLDKLVETKRVRLIISPATQGPDADHSKIESLIKFVMKRARRLFITVLMSRNHWNRTNLVQTLIKCVDENLSDHSLPLDFNTDFSRRVFSLGRNPAEQCYALFNDWDRGDKDLFEIWQWRVMVPVFDHSKDFRFQFKKRHILPFLEVDPKPTSSGFFGEVSRTKIHAHHIRGMDDFPHSKWYPKGQRGNEACVVLCHVIAVKKAKHFDESIRIFDEYAGFPAHDSPGFYHEKEANNLEKARKIDSPHLIKSIAAYQIGQDRCLIFPWADGGNLGNLWQKNERDALDKSCVQWQLLQFAGICSALERLHGANVRHGDLKPENILWFEPEKDRGILQIADIGLASFHEEEANTWNRKGMPTETPSGTSRYEPPEMDEMRGKKIPRSRQYDIWSMGCIILELLVWLVYGHSAVMTFRAQTPHYFWQKVTRDRKLEYQVHEYVLAVMGDLNSQLDPDSAYIHLLELVRESLLVIRISEEYESVPGCREVAREVHKRVKKISDQSRRNGEYLKLKQRPFHVSGSIGTQYQTQEVHEKGGNLAVPGQAKTSIATHKLPTHPEETSLPQEEEVLANIRIGVRKATLDFNNDPRHLGTNHQDVRNDYFLIPVLQ